MNAVIVDDELKSREVLKMLLAEYKNLVIVGEATGIDGAVALINQTKPDLVFLDIKLRTGEGFEILDHFPERQFEIIFITSYENYALKAIKYHAFDYLLKPIDLDDLDNTLSKLTRKFENKAEHLKNGNQCLVVHAGSTVRMIEPPEIHYIIADGAYSTIYSEDGSYSIAKTLKDIEPIIGGSKQFIRINRSVLINIAFIKEYSKGLYFAITTKDGRIFEVSRRKKPEVLSLMNAKNL